MKNELGKYIKETREKLKISQREFEKNTKISKSTISRIESGEIKKPRFEILAKISLILNIPINELLKLAGYDIKERWIYEEKINQIYDNEILKTINQKKINKVITIINNDTYIDIIKILDNYKNNNISQAEAIKLISICHPIMLDNEIIYRTEKGDVFINTKEED